jgi:hypothetical protein
MSRFPQKDHRYSFIFNNSNMKKLQLSLLLFLCTMSVFSQKQILALREQNFELHNVTGSIIKFEGKEVLKIERDLKALPFDVNNIERTVDEPHYARFVGLEDFENGTIEVKMYSQIQNPPPYPGVAGFIGIYFRIKENDSAFEGNLRETQGWKSHETVGQKSRCSVYFISAREI